MKKKVKRNSRQDFVINNILPKAKRSQSGIIIAALLIVMVVVGIVIVWNIVSLVVKKGVNEANTTHSTFIENITTINCVPNCYGKYCGQNDGCGGICNYTECNEGSNCISNCTNKNCGDDGCGGSCGSCLSGYFCIIGKCTTNIINISSCRIISQNGTYVLNTSISSSATCITITSDNVTLDGNGYTLTFNKGLIDNSVGINISGSRKNITIMNFALINDSGNENIYDTEGIAIDTSLTNSLIYNNTIVANGQYRYQGSDGIYFDPVTGAISQNNLFINNNITSRNMGISYTYSSFDVLTNNQFSGGGAGIMYYSSSSNNRLINNNFSNEGAGIIYYPLSNSFNNSLIGNIVNPVNAAGNPDGFDYYCPSSYDTWVNNIINVSGWGIYSSESVSNNNISGNYINSAHAGSIHFTLSSSNNIIIGNILNSTMNHVIYMASSSSDIINNNTIFTPYQAAYSDLAILTATNLTLLNQKISRYSISEPSTLNVINSSLGRIVFLNTITGSSGDLFGTPTSNIRISSNSVYVDPTANSGGLNKNANVTLLNTGVIGGTKILDKNNNICLSPTCTNLADLGSGNYNFIISNWQNSPFKVSV